MLIFLKSIFLGTRWPWLRIPIFVILFLLFQYFFFHYAYNRGVSDTKAHIAEQIRVQETENKLILRGIDTTVRTNHQTIVEKLFKDYDNIMASLTVQLESLEKEYRDAQLDSAIDVTLSCSSDSKENEALRLEVNNQVNQELQRRDTIRMELDDERAKFLIESQWRIYCVDKDSESCRPYKGN